MILNEQEMQMVKELAQKNTKKDLNDEEVLDVVMGFVNDLKRVVIDAWNYIKEVVNDVIKFIHETDNKHTHDWHVPLKIEAPPMPDIKIPRLANARSNI